MYIATANAGNILVRDPDSARTFKAYSVAPATAQSGVLIVHDWLGMSDATRKSADRLAQQGMRVIAIDLYDGQSAKKP